MKSVIPLFLIVLIVACDKQKHKDVGVFKDLVDNEIVVIILANYGLDSIPAEIGQLKNAKSLTISYDSITDGWTVYPPLNALVKRIDLPPYNYLPEEILELKYLENLSLRDLNIKTLPGEFYKLENLKYLDLSMNKLILSNEIKKLAGLKNLKELLVFGNRVDSSDIKKLKVENPDLLVTYK